MTCCGDQVCWLRPVVALVAPAMDSAGNAIGGFELRANDRVLHLRASSRRALDQLQHESECVIVSSLIGLPTLQV